MKEKHVREYDPKNCHSDQFVKEYDQKRKIFKGRCEQCDTAISQEADRFKELHHEGRTWTLCDVCYTMRQAVYFNGQLSNMNYYKLIDLDEATKAKLAAERRKKMGLDDDKA